MKANAFCAEVLKTCKFLYNLAKNFYGLFGLTSIEPGKEMVGRFKVSNLAEVSL
jgi:hypothetical protein